ncbi:MAG: M23 family metallopeptidase [Hyphomicrobiales bacterium]
MGAVFQSSMESRRHINRDRRAYSRAVVFDADDLPPMSEALPTDNRHAVRIDLGWTLGSLLAAIAGALIFGGVLYFSSGRDMKIVEWPEIVSPINRPTEEGGQRRALKGDRLIVANDIISARQTFRVPTSIKVGNREVIKPLPYVRVATNLALNSIGLAADIPPFDPQKFFAGAGAEPMVAPETSRTEGNADVSLVKTNLLTSLDGLQAPDSLTLAQIFAQVEEARRAALSLEGDTRLSIGGQQFLTRTLPSLTLSGITPETSVDSSFSGIEVSIMPENMTIIQKMPPDTNAQKSKTEERLIVVRKGERLDTILAANGINQNQADSVAAVINAQMADGEVKEGQRIKVLLALGADPSATPQLLRAMVYNDDQISAIAAVNDRNQFVAVAPPSEEGSIGSEEQPEGEETTTGISLYNSIYETALKNEIPVSVIEQLIRIYFYDVDLQRRVNGGDSFEVFFAEDEEKPGQAELLYATLSVAGLTKRYYQYRSPEDDSVDFFDEQGKSNRKFLVRKPIAEGIFRSGFGMRYHPILRYSRLHSGVDWANKIGTPILAAGDGVVILANWDTGYGRRVEIQHPYDFMTTYSHLSGFAPGIREGVRVRQGQVIGYLGNSGLSTGPHLHYEVIVKGEFKDPMAIKLPRNRELDEVALNTFKKNREDIDSLMAKAPGFVRTAETTMP